MTRPKNTGVLSRQFLSISTEIGQGKLPLTGAASLFINLPRPRAARSLAIPRTPSASGLFGVIAISMVVSTFDGLLSANQSMNLSPTCPEDSSIIPSCSSLNCISRSEHIIPKLSTPRIFPTPIVVSIPGTNTPGFATTTSIPFRAFGAPQII